MKKFVLLLSLVAISLAQADSSCPDVDFEKIYEEIDFSTVKVEESIKIRLSYLSSICDERCDTVCEVENLVKLTAVPLRDEFEEGFIYYREELTALMLENLPRFLKELNFGEIFPLFEDKLAVAAESPEQKIELRQQILSKVVTCEQFQQLMEPVEGDDLILLENFRYDQDIYCYSYWPTLLSHCQHHSHGYGHGHHHHSTRRGACHH
jgi:hypothetical protein